jgi:hypothetical protein
MIEILRKIEGMFDEKTKSSISKKLNRSDPLFLQISKQMHDMVITSDYLKQNLFKNRLESLYYAGDVLVQALHESWITGEDLEETFLLNMEKASFVYGFDWEHRIKNSENL